MRNWKFPVDKQGNRWLLWVEPKPKQFELHLKPEPVNVRAAEPSLKEFLCVSMREGGLISIPLAATLTGLSKTYLYGLRGVRLKTFTFYGHQFLSLSQLRVWRTERAGKKTKKTRRRESRRTVWVNVPRRRKEKNANRVSSAK